ncbi:MAG TPA: hypothetical protein VIW29_17630 [Polyangiaceae bacterium]
MTSAFETFWAYRASGHATFLDGAAPVSSILEMNAEEKRLTEQRLLPFVEASVTTDPTAVRALGLLQSRLAVPMLESLVHSRPDLRVETALALWRCTGSDKPIDILTTVLFSAGPIVRFLRAWRQRPPAEQLAAIWALAQIQSPLAFATLNRAAYSDQLHPQVTSEALLELTRTIQAGPSTSE